MSLLVIAAIGIVVVLGSILLLRLHPLLGLLIGTLFLLAATPASIVRENYLADKTLSVQAIGANGLVGLTEVIPDSNCLIWLADDGFDQARQVFLQRATPEELLAAQDLGGLSSEALAWYSLVGDDLPTIQKGMLVASSADVSAALDDRWVGIGPRLVAGFSKTFRKLGIPVTMAAIVGICLLRSGAAARLVAAIMKLFGRGGTAPALTFSGFILGIPVFFDNVFYLLLPLAKAVGKKEPKRFLACAMAIIVGASMAHSLVPPTPGPLFVAETMGVSVGMMMVGGFIVGAIAVTAGMAYGMVCSRFIQIEPNRTQENELEALEANQKMSLIVAALPIALPILLLGGSEIVEYLASVRDSSSRIAQLHAWTRIFNDPALIFIGAAIVAIAMLRKHSDSETVAKSVARGIADAGLIILLTSAGGAFGAALQQLQIANAIAEQFNGLSSPTAILTTAFFLTTIIRAAQGSATVAMLTSSAIITPVLSTIELPFHPIYIALAIGCGSKPLPWMNDSGFWQVCTMTGMTPVQTLKSFSVALTIMGVVGFGATLIGAFVFPLV